MFLHFCFAEIGHFGELGGPRGFRRPFGKARGEALRLSGLSPSKHPVATRTSQVTGCEPMIAFSFFRMDSASAPLAVKTINKTTGPKNDRGILLRLCLLAANRLREPRKERGARAVENEARSGSLCT